MSGEDFMTVNTTGSDQDWYSPFSKQDTTLK
jgi:hypothetical protein